MWDKHELSRNSSRYPAHTTGRVNDHRTKGEKSRERKVELSMEYRQSIVSPLTKLRAVVGRGVTT